MLPRYTQRQEEQHKVHQERLERTVQIGREASTRRRRRNLEYNQPQRQTRMIEIGSVWQEEVGKKEEEREKEKRRGKTLCFSLLHRP